MKTWVWFVLVLVLLPLLVVAAGQLGAFRGRPPADLGVSADGLLKAPSHTPNSVSSQANRFAEHPQRDYSQVAPLVIQAPTPAEAIARLRAALVQDPSITVTLQTDRYLRAEARTRWMGYVDDLEFVVRAAAEEQNEAGSGTGPNGYQASGAPVPASASTLASATPSLAAQSWTIDLRSASRLGRSDLGVNRARIEALRARL